MNQKTINFFEKVVSFFEVLLAVIIIVAVVAEGFFLIANLYEFVINKELTENFKEFLGGVLFYIIGLEVALMLITRNPLLIIDVLVFAIARKMIITVDAMLEILIGVIAIALLYFVKHVGIDVFFPKIKAKLNAKNEEVEVKDSAAKSEMTS